MGGYAAFIWALIGILVDDYNKYHFESRMVKQLFTKDPDFKM